MNILMMPAQFDLLNAGPQASPCQRFVPKTRCCEHRQARNPVRRGAAFPASVFLSAFVLLEMRCFSISLSCCPSKLWEELEANGIFNQISLLVMVRQLDRKV